MFSMGSNQLLRDAAPWPPLQSSHFYLFFTGVLLPDITILLHQPFSLPSSVQSFLKHFRHRSTR